MSLNGARFLVFASSAAVLVMEIIAGRLMAPYVGVSLETFTGVIGVVLAGIAVGSWLGGRAADQMDPRSLLGPLLGVSGLFIVVSPSIVDLVGPSMRAGRPLDIVTLTTAAFFVPSVTLSAVTPVVVKLRLRSLAETGSVVGSLSALSTVGALAGTFFTGFVLLSAFPTRPLVLWTGLAVLLFGAALSARAIGRRALALVVMLAALLATGLGASDGPCEYETTYYCAVIDQDEDRAEGRLLWLDTLLHSYVDLADATHLELRYVQLMAAVIDSQPAGPIDAAFLGGGGFTLPRYVAAVRPGSQSTVFEIDGRLVELVQDELGLELSPALRVELGDGRLHLREQATDAFDIVVGDAFGGLSVPWHLTTTEFLADIDRVLRDGGVYVVNVIDYPPNAFAEAMVRTVQDAFAHVGVIAPPSYLRGEDGGNFVLVASQQPLPWDDLERWLTGRVEVLWAGERAAEFADGAPVLRDDYAPVDQMLGRP